MPEFEREGFCMGGTSDDKDVPLQEPDKDSAPSDKDEDDNEQLEPALSCCS